MKIKITPSTTIGDIQEKLSAVYPFLKIKFSDRSHKEGTKVKKVSWYDFSCRIASITKLSHSGSITIRPWHKTGDVEKEFETKFGLHAEIFRKEGDELIETAGTDIFSLSLQNHTGKEMTREQKNSLWIEREKLL